MKNKILAPIYIVVVLFCLQHSNSQAQNDSSHYDHSLYDLSKISVSTQKKENQKIENTTSTIRVITADQIKDNSYYTLEDVLGDLPGFQFRNIMGLNSYTFLRGLPRQNNTIKILIDGIPINELNSGGFYGGGYFNLSNVERIEVQYGPSSVLYGTNALSGIINIITKKPTENKELNANLGLGNFNTYLSDASYYSKGMDLDFVISAMHKYTEKADLTKENNDYLWDETLEIFERDYAVDAKIMWKGLTLGLNYKNRQSSTSTHYPSIGTVHTGNNTLWNLRLVNFYAKYKKNINNKVHLNSTLWARDATIVGNSVKIVTDTGRIAYLRPNFEYGLESTVEYKPNTKIDLIGGIFSYYEALAQGYSITYSYSEFTQPETPVPPEKTTSLLFGAYVEADIRILKKFQFSPGVRAEYSTSYGEVVTPSASLIYNNGPLNTKLIYAQAFRAPKPWDFTDGLGNTDLSPEKYNTLELSNKWFFSENFLTEISLYSNKLFNGIVKEYDTDANDGSYRWVNTGTINSKGAEFLLMGKINKWKITGHYSYVYSVDDNDKKLAEIAPHTISTDT
jgi:outer membrane cobalamin receptor